MSTLHYSGMRNVPRREKKKPKNLNYIILAFKLAHTPLKPRKIRIKLKNENCSSDAVKTAWVRWVNNIVWVNTYISSNYSYDIQYKNTKESGSTPHWRKTQILLYTSFRYICLLFAFRDAPKKKMKEWLRIVSKSSFQCFQIFQFAYVRRREFGTSKQPVWSIFVDKSFFLNLNHTSCAGSPKNFVYVIRSWALVNKRAAAHTVSVTSKVTKDV